MSYCRFAWDGSDVYVFESADGIECCGCMLQEGGFFTAKEPEEMLVHLAEHRRAGHFVPDYAVTALWEDIPGAQRAREPEAPSLTLSSIMMETVWHESKAQKLRAEYERRKEADQGQE